MSIGLEFACKLNIENVISKINESHNKVNYSKLNTSDWLIRKNVHLVVSPLNNFVCIAVDDTLFLVDLETFNEIPDDYPDICGEKGEVITSVYWYRTGATTTILMIGTSEGNFILYDPQKEECICKYNFNMSPILRIKLVEQECKKPSPRIIRHLLIVYSGIVVRVLESRLKEFLSNYEETDIFHCNKFILKGQKKVNDIVFIEREKKDSVMDVLKKKRDDCFIAVGMKPCLAYFKVGNIESKSSGDSNVAKKVTSFFYSVAKSWSWWGKSDAENGSQDQKEEEEEEEDEKKRKVNIPSHPLSTDFSFFDTPREVYSIDLNRSASNAIFSDSLGRVFVLDTKQFLILKVLKGYREAQCFWIHRSRTFFPSTIKFFMIHQPLRGFIELWQFRPASSHSRSPLFLLKTIPQSTLFATMGEQNLSISNLGDTPESPSKLSATPTPSSISPKHFFVLHPSGDFNMLKFKPPQQYNPFNVTSNTPPSSLVRQIAKKGIESTLTSKTPQLNKEGTTNRDPSSKNSNDTESLISTIPIDRINEKDEELLKLFQSVCNDPEMTSDEEKMKSWKKLIRQFRNFDYIVRCLDLVISSSTTSSEDEVDEVSVHIELAQFAYRSFTTKIKKKSKKDKASQYHIPEDDEMETIKKYVEQRIRFLQAYQQLMKIRLQNSSAGVFDDDEDGNEFDEVEDDFELVFDDEMEVVDEEEDDDFLVVKKKPRKKKKKKRKKGIQEDWFQNMSPDLIEKLLKVEDDCCQRLTRKNENEEEEERTSTQAMSLSEFISFLSSESNWIGSSTSESLGGRSSEETASADFEKIGSLFFDGDLERNWDDGDGPLRTVIDLLSTRMQRIPYALYYWFSSLSSNKKKMGKLLCVRMKVYEDIILHCLNTTNLRYRFIIRVLEMSHQFSRSYQQNEGNKKKKKKKREIFLVKSRMRNGMFVLLLHICRNLIRKRIKRKKKEISVSIEDHLMQRTDVLRLQSILKFSPVLNLLTLKSYSNISLFDAPTRNEPFSGQNWNIFGEKGNREVKVLENGTSYFTNPPSLNDLLAIEQIQRMKMTKTEEEKSISEEDVKSLYFDFSSTEKFPNGKDKDEDEGVELMIFSEITEILKLFPQLSRPKGGSAMDYSHFELQETNLYFSAANQAIGRLYGRHGDFALALRFIDAIGPEDGMARLGWYVLQWNLFVQEILNPLVTEILMTKSFCVSELLSKIGFEEEREFLRVLEFHRKLISLFGRELHQNEEKEKDDMEEFEAFDDEEQEGEGGATPDKEMKDFSMSESDPTGSTKDPPDQAFWFDIGKARLSRLLREVEGCHLQSEDLTGIPNFLYFLQLVVELHKHKLEDETSASSFRTSTDPVNVDVFQLDLEKLFEKSFLFRVTTPIGKFTKSEFALKLKKVKEIYTDDKLRFKRKGFFIQHLPKFHSMMLKCSVCFDNISKDFVNLEVMKIYFLKPDSRQEFDEEKGSINGGDMFEHSKTNIEKAKALMLQINSSMKIGSTLIGICREKMKLLVTVIGKNKRKLHLLSQMENRLYKWIMTSSISSYSYPPQLLESTGGGKAKKKLEGNIILDKLFSNLSQEDIEREEEKLVKELIDLLQMVMNHLSGKKKSIQYKKAQKMMNFVQKLDY